MLDRKNTEINKILQQNERFKSIIKEKALEQSDFLLEMEPQLIEDMDTNYRLSSDIKIQGSESSRSDKNSLRTNINGGAQVNNGDSISSSKNP